MSGEGKWVYNEQGWGRARVGVPMYNRVGVRVRVLSTNQEEETLNRLKLEKGKNKMKKVRDHPETLSTINSTNRQTDKTPPTPHARTYTYRAFLPSDPPILSSGTSSSPTPCGLSAVLGLLPGPTVALAPLEPFPADLGLVMGG